MRVKSVHSPTLAVCWAVGRNYFEYSFNHQEYYTTFTVLRKEPRKL